MKLSLLSTALGTVLFATVFASNSTESEQDPSIKGVQTAVELLQSPRESNDYQAGVALLRQLAKQGNVHAMVKLGELLESGTGIDDFEYAISSYLQAAEAGYAPAEELIANAYFKRGLNEGPRTALGRQYLSRAAVAYERLAERDSPEALWNLGYLLTTGHGIERDHDLGFAYITRASKLGNASASFWLANFYKANPGQAAPGQLYTEHLQRAAGQGSALALATLNSQGTTDPLPYAAQSGPASANLSAAPASAQAPEVVVLSPEPEVAVIAAAPAPQPVTTAPISAAPPVTAYYEELDAVRGELRQAQNEIAQLRARLRNYELDRSDAEGLNQDGLQAVMANDYELAATRFRQAAELNHPGAIANLGTLHLNGTGVTRDGRQAVALFERAVKLGNVTAAENLGRTYQYGLGIRADRGRAIRWYMTAEDMGSTHATEALRALHEK